MASLRRRADTELERLDKVFDRFRTLKVQDLEGDEMLYREMRDRYGRWFDGAMGAAAIQKRLETFDLAAEAEILKDHVSHCVEDAIQSGDARIQRRKIEELVATLSRTGRK